MIPSATYLLWTLRLTFAAVILSDLEIWSLRQMFKRTGFLGIPVPRVTPSVWLLSKCLGQEHRYWLISGLVLSRVSVSIAGEVFGRDLLLQRALITALLLQSIVIRRIPRLGNNASDDMLFVVQVVLAIAVYADTLGVALAFFFLSGQMSLAYLTAGLSKATQPEWWSGGSIHKILSSTTFGHKQIYRFVRSAPRLKCFLGSSTILGELVLSLSPWLAPQYAVELLFLAVCFHAGVAAVMGLNTFLPAFVTLYPAALYTSLTLHPHAQKGYLW